MAAAVERLPNLATTQDANPNHDPALTDDHERSAPHAPPQETTERVSSASPAPADEINDLEAEIDTRKHMEAPRNAEGRMICIRPGCESLRFDRKCEWSKHMDKHDRPYRCPDAACVKLKGFTYSGGLLRHQREVHKQHGGPKDQMLCPIPFCKRNNGPGFTRKENLNEHIRRVHRQPILKEPEETKPKRRERRSLRRRSASALNVEGNMEDIRAEVREDVPVDTTLMGAGADECTHTNHPAPQAPMTESQGDETHTSSDVPKQLHPYPQAETISVQQQAHVEQDEASHPAMTQEQAQQLTAQHQQSQVQVHHPAVPPDFQVAAPGLMEAQQYEVAFLRQELDRLRRECEDKDQRIARLEAGLAGAQQVETR